MIHLKIGPARFIDATEDPMGREWVGWTPEQTPEEIYERNRGVWYLSSRADREQYTAFSSTVTGMIVVVVANEEVEDADGRRRKIMGTVLGPGHPVHDRLVGQPMPDRFRNPVTYHEDPIERRTCACGCGELVHGGRTFLAGHDQRAVHERIARQWGDTMGFITWFDREYGTAD